VTVKLNHQATDAYYYYCLSNALHSSIGQNIKSRAFQCPVSSHSVKNFKWPYLSHASSDRLRAWF